MDDAFDDLDARVEATRAAAWLRVLPAAGPPAETFVRRAPAGRRPAGSPNG